jgi:hypothetical protein
MEASLRFYIVDIASLGGGGRIGVRERSDHAPTPQAGRVTDSDGGGRVRVGGGGCERSSATLFNKQFIQKHRGGPSNLQKARKIMANVHFITRLLLRRLISLCAFS